MVSLYCNLFLLASPEAVKGKIVLWLAQGSTLEGN